MGKPKILSKIDTALNEVDDGLSAINKMTVRTFVFTINGEIVADSFSAHAIAPFDCKISNVNCSISDSSSSVLKLQLQHTSDNVNWSDLLTSPLTINSGNYEVEINLSDTLDISKNDKLRLHVLESANDFSNITVNASADL